MKNPKASSNLPYDPESKGSGRPCDGPPGLGPVGFDQGLGSTVRVRDVVNRVWSQEDNKRLLVVCLENQ